MNLKLIRKFFTDKTTIGELYINGVFECYILEDMVREKTNVNVSEWKIQGKTAIPYGVYPVVIDFSNRFKMNMPHILNVSGFTGIRIHWGNTEVDTDGCLITGRTMKTNFVGESKIAYNELIKKLIVAHECKQYIELTIEKITNKKEDTVKKSIVKSKTFWTGIGIFGFGIFQIVSGEVDTGLKTIMEGAGLIFLRQSIK